MGTTFRERAEVLLMVIAVTMAFITLLAVGPGLKWIYPKQHGEMLMLFKAHPVTEKVIGDTEELNLMQFWQLQMLVEESQS
ncbi:hypothetical protein [Rheinheimera hassiensis]|uniref:hypothetical protein n=1 Tax=Rheinheimera hassiensis TaxID=1193627 RepID=UPI001F055BB3|nr:hypothetical protein [Rheinheimera hassiensis]